MLDRLRADFDGLRIFFTDPVLPDNGSAGRNWCDDFQLTLHYVDQEGFERHTPASLAELATMFREYQPEEKETSGDD